MNTDSNAMARPTPLREAEAAQQAITDPAKAENLRRVAELSDGADEAQVGAHARGMVAATMGHLSADASAVTRSHAERWQDWALGVADGLEQGVQADVGEHLQPRVPDVSEGSYECIPF